MRHVLKIFSLVNISISNVIKMFIILYSADKYYLSSNVVLKSSILSFAEITNTPFDFYKLMKYRLINFMLAIGAFNAILTYKKQREYVF